MFIALSETINYSSAQMLKLPDAFSYWGFENFVWIRFVFQGNTPLL